MKLLRSERSPMPLLAPETHRERRVRPMNRSAETTPLERIVSAGQPAFLGGQLLSKLGHELRGPLTGIIGLTRILVRNTSAGPVNAATQVRQLNLLLTSAIQMLRVTEQVVDISRLQSPVGPPVLVEFDCAQVVADTVRTHQPAATARGIRLVTELPDGPLLITAENRLFSRLLYELVDNAVKYADRGEVRIRIMDPHPDVVTIEVADPGPGITAAERSRIFEPFERGEAASAGGDGGAGLGLYLARQVAKRLGAKLSLSGEEHRGTTFTIEIPRRPPPAAGPADQGKR
jgi:signal transduction histidine kinase